VQPPSRHGDRGAGDDDDQARRRFLTGPQVCARYGISDMGIWRWLRDPELGFPQPALRIKDRRYWDEAELVTWERSAAARQSERRNQPPPRRRGARAMTILQLFKAAARNAQRRITRAHEGVSMLKVLNRLDGHELEQIENALAQHFELLFRDAPQGRGGQGHGSGAG
jgi:predicted DNA-binding transcriptional regulator AlpA